MNRAKPTANCSPILAALVIGAFAGAACESDDPVQQTPDAGPTDAGNLDAQPGEYFAVVSTEDYQAQPGPNCTTEFIDYDCDALIPLECGVDEHVDYADQVICPVCAVDSADDPDNCFDWRYRYGDFLRHLVKESCANWCDTDTDCFAWEINNACGSYALSLIGNIDEEPLYFAKLFAEHNCGQCGQVEQTEFLRRFGSTLIEGEGQHNGLLESYGPACRGNQCVLVRYQ